MVPASTGWYPRPRANQSLLHFLSESVSMGRHGGRAELDRENAHFIMSETVISTFEQMNFERSLDNIEEHDDAVENDDEDDEEIRRLQNEIRRRRNEKRKRKQNLTPSTCLSDGQTDTVTTDQSASPGYSDIDHDNTDQVSDDPMVMTLSAVHYRFVPIHSGLKY